jgi:orotate phosphoribosyltransferase
MQDEVGRILARRTGHFALESGHHGELWLDLELLLLDPGRLRPLAGELATRLARHDVAMVCGPLVEGAFVALLVAAALGKPFAYTERVESTGSAGLFPVTYRVPRALRAEVRGRRVAIVNDVINAGSAVRGTFDDLLACRAVPAVIGTLAVLGESASRLAAERDVALETLASFPNRIWEPAACPLCADGVALTE